MGIDEKLRKAIREVHGEVRAYLEDLGQRSVNYAKEHGSYKDVTGHLRASNKYEATDTVLTVENTAEYASYVEARGYDVISGAKLLIRSELDKPNTASSRGVKLLIRSETGK